MESSAYLFRMRAGAMGSSLEMAMAVDPSGNPSCLRTGCPQWPDAAWCFHNSILNARLTQLFTQLGVVGHVDALVVNNYAGHGDNSFSRNSATKACLSLRIFLARHFDSPRFSKKWMLKRQAVQNKRPLSPARKKAKIHKHVLHRFLGRRESFPYAQHLLSLKQLLWYSTHTRACQSFRSKYAKTAPAICGA